MKLFWKIYSAVFICFLLIVTGMSAFIIKSQIANATDSMIKLQKTVGAIMIDEVEKGYLVNKLPFQSLKFLTEYESFSFWWIVKPNGKVYLADDVKSIGIEAFEEIPQVSGSIGDDAISVIGKDKIVFIKTFGYGTNKMSFWLGFTTKDIQAAKNRIIPTTITCAFASMIVLGLMIYFVINHFIMPIQKLTVAAGKIGSGQFDCKVDNQSNDEIGLLTDAFNKMMVDLKQTTTSMDKLNHEIGERKHAEETMKRLNENLEEANNEMKHFVYIASHDLREPLRKITAFGAILEKSLKDKLDSEDATNFHYMIDGAKRMSQMIDGLLSYSRINTKGQEWKNIELDKTINELNRFELGVLLEETHTKINIPEPLPSIKADPVQMRQLMQNIIANGVKYQKKGNIPEITITSKPAANNMIRIEITDNGIGIAPEYQQAVFTMFKRLHSRSEYEGTGIGLSVCKKIVERHGGQIGVESQTGKGSTFWFTVPAATALIGAETS
ncbi:MAG: hypothetical protein A2Y10_13910 [Planctomycetes bacterium GWF2_41_51]|nr:MAG: hypothetical protein A2Y10_13910 [Planctomycetes bacterium GWF2_41_51]